MAGVRGAIGRGHTLARWTFFPILFTQRETRKHYHPRYGTEKLRTRTTAAVIANNPDARLTGELLLRAIKEGA